MSIYREFKTFFKAQISAFVGGVVDYMVMLASVEILGWHYIYGIVLGGIVGALVNFSANRYWSFKGRVEGLAGQLPKFIIIVVLSVMLKSMGTSVLTEIAHIDYRVSRLLTDAIVSLGFNYTLQRFWVFRKQMSLSNK